MNTQLSYIIQSLNELDIEGLLQIGAPNDEYNSEADEIVKAIGRLTSDQQKEENLIAIISMIWAKSFNLGNNELALRMPSIRALAKRIL